MYHHGEITAQENAGERITGNRNGRMVIDKIIPGAINFIEKQPYFIASSRCKNGEITVSALAGGEGFLKVLNENSLQINPSLLQSNPFDIFWKNIEESPHIGLLFIEAETRRRYRVNGTLQFQDGPLIMEVVEAYPNCPKYIQKRQVFLSDVAEYYSETLTGTIITAALSNMIKNADTFFVGSSGPEGHMDVSHRGGAAGFVLIENEDTLIIPDYSGNSMFNTLGNFVVNPKGGLLFLDFSNKNNLQISGLVEIVWNSQDSKVNTGGTNRYWKFKVEKWILSENLKGVDWKFLEYSPFNP